MVLARRRQPLPEAIKRRDLIKPSLPAADLAAADQAVKNWRAKPAIAEANEVPEQDSWRAEGEAPNKALVARAQALLDKLGYDIGAADGEAGARTREAVKAFELRNGMDETGEVAARHQARAVRWLASPQGPRPRPNSGRYPQVARSAIAHHTMTIW